MGVWLKNMMQTDGEWASLFINNWVVTLSYITGGVVILLMLAKYWDSVLAKSGCTTRGNSSIDQ